MIHEFDEVIPVDTPLGRGEAIFVECDNHDNFWTVILDNRAIVTFRQEQIRARRSYSHGRGITNAEMAEIVRNKNGNG